MCNGSGARVSEPTLHASCTPLLGLLCILGQRYAEYTSTPDGKTPFSSNFLYILHWVLLCSGLTVKSSAAIYARVTWGRLRLRHRGRRRLTSIVRPQCVSVHVGTRCLYTDRCRSYTRSVTHAACTQIDVEVTRVVWHAQFLGHSSHAAVDEESWPCWISLLLDGRQGWITLGEAEVQDIADSDGQCGSDEVERDGEQRDSSSWMSMSCGTLCRCTCTNNNTSRFKCLMCHLYTLLGNFDC